MSPRDDEWIEEEAGTAARLYTVTGGRTRPIVERKFDLIDLVEATGAEPHRAFSPAPEHLRILGLCRRPLAVAEVAAGVGLPLGVVHVLLGDLLHEDLVRVFRQAQRVTDRGLLQKVLDGLNAILRCCPRCYIL